ncbi:hypothetical protein [Crocosphaera sp.]|nr:hypothetical protein [Crocosphaera sp.]MDJ0582983.1 hypothetical protein [Crocosphaera sp.]
MLYETDIIKWVEQQVSLIKEGRSMSWQITIKRERNNLKHYLRDTTS